MSQFTVHFSTDNDAFESTFGVIKNYEIARILEQLAKEVREGGSDRVIRLRDTNGARVGFATGLNVADVPVVVDER